MIHLKDKNKDYQMINYKSVLRQSDIVFICVNLNEKQNMINQIVLKI